MIWHDGQATLRKEGGVWRQNPQVLLVPDRESYLSFKDAAKLTRFMKERGWDEDTRPYVIGTKTTYKWKRKAKKMKGGDSRNGNR